MINYRPGEAVAAISMMLLVAGNGGTGAEQSQDYFAVIQIGGVE